MRTENDQTEKGLYQTKRNDKELMTYTEYALGLATSEELRSDET